MSSIDEIYKVCYMKDQFSYVGTLRNQKKFELTANVFFTYGSDGKIARGRIVGIELPPAQNPEYKYKIELPEEVVREFGESECKSPESIKSIEITCEHIFSTIKEAKESAIKNLDNMAELQRKDIESYFKQFENIK